jgi:uncharacterized protein DUF6913
LGFQPENLEFAAVKLTFLQMRTQSALKKNRAVRATISYQASKQVGILFTVEDKLKHQQVKDFVAKLQHDGKQVQVLEFLPKKKENPEFMYDFFTIEDLSFWGKINSEQADKFSKLNFDYLFIADTKPNPLILNVLANCKAHCRIGKFDPAAESYFELMIETNGSVQALIDNMYEYTKKLR